MTLQHGTPVVPRFSSFKPKARPQADTLRPTDRESDPQSPRSESKETRSVTAHDGTDSQKHTSHDYHRSRGHHRHRREGREIEDRHVRRDQPKRDHISEDDIGQFFLDRTGDPNNLRYGRLHRYSVPEYRLFGRGNVLGAPRHPPYPKDNNRLLSTRNKRSADSDVLQKPLKDAPFDTDSDFVDLDSQARKRRKSEGSKDSSDDSDGAAHYRSIEGKGTALDSSPVILPLEDQPGGKDVDLEKRRQMATLSRLAEDNSTVVEPWLALIDYQDQIKTSTATKAEIRSLIDIKMSIYEKAIAKVGKHRGRDRLLFGLLEEGSKLWDFKKLASRWRSTIDENPDYLSLWLKYLDFQQANFLSFSFDECRAVYIKVLQRMSKQPSTPETDQMYIYVFLRYTSFLMSCGFSEQAVALWEAILEYTLLKPDSGGQSCSIDSFSDFWESEVPRIGEEDAKGWKHANQAAAVDPKTDVLREHLEDSPSRIFDSWARCERERILNARMPARTMDDVEEDDPYRVILWSDVKDFIFQPSSEAGREMLIGAFCKFCGLPPIIFENVSSLSWWTDPFLVSKSAGIAWLRESEGFKAPENGQPSRPQNRHVYPVTQVFPDAATLFPSRDNQWFSQWTDVSLEDDDDISPGFKLRALRLLTDNLLLQNALAEYTVALQFQIDQKEAKKLAKGLLKKQPNSLCLYNAYALLESRSGHEEIAERVWTTALSMRKTFSEQDQQDSILLWRTWIWDALDLQLFGKALRLLLAIPTGRADVNSINDLKDSTPSPSEILGAQQVSACHTARARLTNMQHLQRHLERSISLRLHSTTLHYSDLLALLTYLAAPERTLDRVLEIYNFSFPPTATSIPSNENPLSELAAQCLARIIHLHATTAPIHQPKATLRYISHILQSHPDNTLLLSLVHQHSQHLLVTDRIRSLAVVPTPDSHTTHLSLLDHPRSASIIPILIPLVRELSRPASSGSTPHSVRAAFEAAVAAQPSSPTIWNLYIEWCLEQVSSTTPTTTTIDIDMKALIYRTLRATPWACKNLVLWVLGDERVVRLKTFSWEEKKALWEVLEEKGFRVHIDLDLEERLEASV